MSVINVKGLLIQLMKDGALSTPLTATAISKASPAVVTVADTAGITKGDVVMLNGFGKPELDGKTFVVGTVDATAKTFELAGADTSGWAADLAVIPPASSIAHYIATDLVTLCLSSIDIGAPSVNQIDISTFCGDATMAGRATPGSLTLNGYADKDDAGVAELLLADEDGKERLFIITLPNGNGFYMGKIALAGFVLGFPNEGAVSFTITGSQVEKIHWVI